MIIVIGNGQSKSVSDFNLFKKCFNKSKLSIDTWLTDSQYQINKIKALKSDLSKFTQYLENECSIKINYLWNKIYVWNADNLGEECIEYIVSMMMEPYDKIIDPLINEMSSEEEKYFNIPTHRKVSDLKAILENNYKSIIKIDENVKDGKEIEKIVICDVQNEIYPKIEKIFLNLLDLSGFSGVKIEKKIDFNKLYNERIN